MERSPAGGLAETGGRAAPADSSCRPAANPDRGPVLVLSFMHSGAEHLQQLLIGNDRFACTSGTGIVPMCATILGIWRRAEGRSGHTSAVAASSTRALVTAQVAVILARKGASRWCELATSPADAITPFLDIFPQTKVICLYRACEAMVTTAIRSSPWGSVSLGIGEHSAAFPGNTAAALVAYWADRTEGLLALEGTHPGMTLRVRYEDTFSERHQVMRTLNEFLALGSEARRHGEPSEARLGPERAASFAFTFTSPADDEAPSIPTGLIPPSLRERAAELHDKLGYQPPQWLSH